LETWGKELQKHYEDTNNPNDQFVAKPITIAEITAGSLEVSPSLLKLINKEQFGGSATEGSSLHMHKIVTVA
jgi:hypothetical protein